MIYMDTSVLLALFLAEQKTADAWHWFRQQTQGTVWISEWTRVELNSALGIKARMQAITAAEHQQVLADLHDFIRLELNIVTPLKHDFQRAGRLCHDHWHLGLRAGDALHLALAERHRLTLCTLDKAMASTAQALVMTVISP